MPVALPPKVNPGDLIRADMITEVLGLLLSLDQRVHVLELTSGAGSGLFITSIIPAGPVRVGEEMQILGQNFGFSIGAHRVFIDGIQVFGFKPGSTDQKLVFNIPDIPNVPVSGKAVILSVSNQTATEIRTINVLPMQIALGGNVDVSFDSVQPTTIVPGGPASFRYKVRSRVNQQAQFTLSGTVSGVPNPSDWQTQIHILRDDGSENTAKTMTLQPLEEQFFKVQIAIVPATPATFTLTANAAATGVVSTPASGSYTVNVVVPTPDPTTSLNFQSAIPASAFAAGTLTLAKGASAQITLLANFTSTGTFRVTHGVVAGSGWSTAAALGTPQNDFQVTSADLTTLPHQRVFPFIITASSLASATGRAELRLERVGGSGLKQIFSFD